MNDYTNIEKALEIARTLKIEIPQKYAVRVIKNKELQKKQAEQERISAKLGNKNFVERAPAAVVDKEKARLSEIETASRQLEEQLAKIKAL